MSWSEFFEGLVGLTLWVWIWFLVGVYILLLARWSVILLCLIADHRRRMRKLRWQKLLGKDAINLSEYLVNKSKGDSMGAKSLDVLCPICRDVFFCPAELSVVQCPLCESMLEMSARKPGQLIVTDVKVAARAFVGAEKAGELRLIHFDRRDDGFCRSLGKGLAGLFGMGAKTRRVS